MYIGIDVGGTNLVAGLVDENGKILHKASCPVDKSMTAEELTRQLAKLSRRPKRPTVRSLRSRRRAWACPVW